MYTALGVGPKATAPPEPRELLMEATTPGELDLYGSADSTAMETADATAVMRASYVSPTIARSPAAMQSLMEQGAHLPFYIFVTRY